MNLREAAQQALEALNEYVPRDDYENKPVGNVMEVLRSALAEPEQEPEQNTVTCVCGAVWEGNLMVHAPRQRKPLTDEEIWRKYQGLWPFHPAAEPKLAADIAAFARAIERAHGIGGEA